MPSANEELASCEKTLFGLESKADALLERFVLVLEDGRGFHPMMEKIESQIRLVKRKLMSQSELELNEASVMAQKLSGELGTVSRMARGAALLDAHDKWTEGFEAVRASIEKMALHLKKAKRLSRSKANARQARGVLLGFHNEARKCSKEIAALEASFDARQGGHVAKLSFAKRSVGMLGTLIENVYKSLMRKRMQKKVDEMRTEICGFMKRANVGRIFVDHKHLTLTGNGDRMRIPLTQTVRFSLEEIAPVGRELANLDKNVMVGSFCRHEGKVLLRIGEREVVGDSVVLREKSFLLN